MMTLRSFGRIAALLLSLVGAAHAASIPVQVHGQAVVVPAPDGFAVFTPAMQPAYDRFELLNPKQNLELAAFITTEDANVASQGGQPDLHRFYSVQIPKGNAIPALTVSQFGQVKQIIREKNAEIIKGLDLTSINTQSSAALAKLVHGTANLKIHGMVPLPVHAETERSMSYSALIHIEAQATPAHGPMRQKTLDLVATVNFALIHGQVMFFYAFGQQNDLDWTRAVSKAWLAQVIAANPER